MNALWLLTTVIAPLLLAMALFYAIIRERLEIRRGEKGLPRGRAATAHPAHSRKPAAWARRPLTLKA